MPNRCKDEYLIVSRTHGILLGPQASGHENPASGPAPGRASARAALSHPVKASQLVKAQLPGARRARPGAAALVLRVARPRRRRAVRRRRPVQPRRLRGPARVRAGGG